MSNVKICNTMSFLLSMFLMYRGVFICCLMPSPSGVGIPAERVLICNLVSHTPWLPETPSYQPLNKHCPLTRARKSVLLSRSMQPQRIATSMPYQDGAWGEAYPCSAAHQTLWGAASPGQCWLLSCPVLRRHGTGTQP